MKQRSFFLTISLIVLFLFSCYHARIETGLYPSPKVIEKTFASGWIYGLVPPSTVNVAKGCPDGVAIVETELSFVNQLVGILTFGIYTPMHIKVTCASSSSIGSIDATKNTLVVPIKASENEVIEAFELAAIRAVTNKQPVYVQFK